MKKHDKITHHLDEGDVFLHEMEEMKLNDLIFTKKVITQHLDEGDVFLHEMEEQKHMMH